jgi:putative toxin-antitoxin system antitoxin component (TIGR02293 family)
MAVIKTHNRTGVAALLAESASSELKPAGRGRKSGARRFGLTEQSPAAAVSSIREGFASQVVGDMAETFLLDRSSVARLIGVSTRTLQRIATDKKGRLDAVSSDRIYRLERVYRTAVDAFGDSEKAVGWFKRPNWIFKDQTPLELLDTEAGREQVEAELRKIQYGIYL